MVSIHDRVLADLGLPGFEVQEPALAVSRNRRLGAAQKPSAQGPFRSVTATAQSSSWASGEVLPPGPVFQPADATCTVVNGVDQTFVLFGVNGVNSSSGKIRYTTWLPAQGFTAWKTAYSATQNNCGGVSLIVVQDKPWVLRRSASDYYVFFWRGCRYSYLRTSDGLEWGDVDSGAPAPIYDVATTSPDPVVAASFCCHPAAAADGSVFLAHATGQFGSDGQVRVLIGVDPEGDGAGPLVWSYAKDAEGVPIQFAPRYSQALNLPVPDTTESYKSETVPTIVCDPTSAEWAHIVYHDVAADDPNDVNVYIASIERQDGAWTLHAPRSIHDEVLLPGGARASQCTPSVTIDSRGWIHVQYYDNRPSYLPDPEYEIDQYDAWYALSTDRGATFRRSNLRTSGDALPAMDLGLQGVGINAFWSPREYNGIGIYESGTDTRVWLLYAGTSNDEADDPTRRTVLWGQQVVVATGN